MIYEDKILAPVVSQEPEETPEKTPGEETPAEEIPAEEEKKEEGE